MIHSPPEVVLRQLRLDGTAALLARTRPAAGDLPPADPAASAARSGYEEGLRSGREEGLRLGYEDGRKQGLQAAQAAAQEAERMREREVAQAEEQRAQELRSVSSALQQALQAVAAKSEDDMVQLCFETITRVIGEAAQHRESVRAQVRALLSQWLGAPPIAVHLHPGDLALLREGGAAPGVPCVADPQVEAGGCIVRGTQGALDARLDRVLDAVRQTLLAARGVRQSAP